jgi:tRNA G18 (ribose-2'-O)-methylase SpoU
MATVVRVDHHDDARLSEYAALTDARARHDIETAQGCFVVEGLLALEAAVTSAYPLRSVLVSDRKVERVLAVVGDLDVEVFVAEQSLLETVTGFRIHRGVVASASRRPLPEAGAVVAGASRIAVLEGVNDHENLGALFRNAAAFGVDALLLDPTTADPLYRRAVRVSVGHVLRTTWTRTDPLPAGLAAVEAAGFTTVALTPAGDTDVRDLAGQGGVAWLLGAEGAGLTAQTLAAADVRARIPMSPVVDSLNVATAAAVAFALTAAPPRRPA